MHCSVEKCWNEKPKRAEFVLGLSCWERSLNLGTSVAITLQGNKVCWDNRGEMKDSILVTKDLGEHIVKMCVLCSVK